MPTSLHLEVQLLLFKHGPHDEPYLLQRISVAKEGDSADISSEPEEDMTVVGIISADGELKQSCLLAPLQATL